MKLGLPERRRLLALARNAVRAGLEGRPPAVPEPLLPPLDSPAASFVTLSLNTRLRGCIGSLEPRRPLGEDVALNAFAAAFRDPRFPPVSDEEARRLRISVSILDAPEELRARGFTELPGLLRPRIDGLIVDDCGRRATFLPSVWAQLPEPRAFLGALWRKAGLPDGHWSPTLRLWRYGTFSFDE